MVEQSNKRVGKYLLVAYDWSHLDYKKHTKKKELITKNKKGNAKQIGYDLQGSLATEKKIYSTYNNNIDKNLTHLEELVQRKTKRVVR